MLRYIKSLSSARNQGAFLHVNILFNSRFGCYYPVFVTSLCCLSRTGMDNSVNRINIAVIFIFHNIDSEVSNRWLHDESFAVTQNVRIQLKVNLAFVTSGIWLINRPIYCRRRLKYTTDDDKAILHCLLDNDRYKKCGGNEVWQELEQLKVCTYKQWMWCISVALWGQTVCWALESLNLDHKARLQHKNSKLNQKLTVLARLFFFFLPNTTQNCGFSA